MLGNLEGARAGFYTDLLTSSMGPNFYSTKLPKIDFPDF